MCYLYNFIKDYKWEVIVLNVLKMDHLRRQESKATTKIINQERTEGQKREKLNQLVFKKKTSQSN